MKKNVIMRAACVVLVLTLLSTCMISGTFAKYVTTGPEAADKARVAEWGVTIEGTGVMFGDSYDDKASGNDATTFKADEKENTITVQANTAGTKIIAPGTNGSLAALDVKGTPEVDTQVSYEADLVLTGWTVDGAVYCPLEITVGTETFKVGDDGIADTAALETKVEEAIVAKGARYHTNENLSAVNDDVQVSWAWDFEGNDDVKDTALGNAAADPADNSGAATVELTITATITQID